MKKNKVLSRIALIAFLVVLLSSCVSKQKILYVQDIETSLNDQVTSYENTIQQDDVLRITVSSKNMETVAPYNPTIGIATNNGLQAAGQARLLDYLVNVDGTITFPQLGKIEVAGLTRVEAQEKLATELRKFVTDAAVDIRIVNFKFTVLGEVNRPGTFATSDNRMTLIQALGMAGDLTIYGKRDAILILRDTNGVQTSTRVDITASDFIYSDFYYLNQNDTIVVDPNNAQVQGAGFNRNASFWVSVASLLLSAIIVISNVSR